MATKKTPVIEHLYKRYLAGQLPSGIATQEDVAEAIKKTKRLQRGKKKLSATNPANFLKDIIRKGTANDHWPPSLIADGVTARQRYGEKRVFQFVKFQTGQSVPFPDHYLPTAATSIHDLQSASIPFAARQLGRKEESWLMQVAVALRIVETQLSLFSPLRDRLHDITHLQMSMKTQPEIDGVFLASHGSSRDMMAGTEMFSVVTCEAKQIGERILADQIREQVAEAFAQTKELAKPEIRSVKPIAVQVREVAGPKGAFRAIYVVEFARITRKAFEAGHENSAAEPERLYAMPLTAVSSVLYRLTPAVRGVNAD